MSLLEKAIADAKEVRNVALDNAKLALQETFTPKLQAAFAAKIAEEMEGEEDELNLPMEGDEEMEDPAMDVPAEEESPEFAEEPVEVEVDAEVPAEEEPAFEDEDDLELEAIIRELEGADEEEMEGPEHEAEEEMNEADLNELDLGTLSDAEAMLSMLAGVVGVPAAALLSTYKDKGIEAVKRMLKTKGVKSEGADADTEVDAELEESIRAIMEMDDDLSGEDNPGPESEMTENSDIEALRAENAELKEANETMMSTLHEVNLLNSKLLYNGKLNQSFNLSQDQKLRVIETFDRAKDVREVKLIYTTLAESLNNKGSKKSLSESKRKSDPKRILESKSSRAEGSTKPTKQIINENQKALKSRFQKLAFGNGEWSDK